MEYGTVGGAVSTIAQIKLDVLGPEERAGFATTHMRTTISSSTASQTYDMWLDANGTFRGLALVGSVEYSAALAQAIGPSLVSGFLIALTAMDNPQVQAALSGELQSPALSTKVTKRPLGNTEVDTIELQVSGGNGASVTAYMSDFGSFTMMTEFRSVLGSTTTYIEFIDMTLK
jgi:hypothetical protein